jgi:diguanylate cyclase (GGDEF)-like protein
MSCGERVTGAADGGPDERTELSGVVVRRALEQALGEELRAAQRQVVAVVICDLDRFHRVNETLGYAAGDDLLRVLADRLRVAAAPLGRLVRVDGDRFVLVLTRLAGPADLDGAVERLQQAIRPSLCIGGRLLFASATIGRAWRLVDGSGADALPTDLLGLADADLHRRKERHRARPALDSRYDLLQLDTDLHVAVDAGALVVHFQPLYDLRSGRLTGFEALARWPHPAHGFVPPDVFIPVAEDDGLIHAVGEHVLRAAHRFLLADEDPTRRMYVNVSTE